MTFSFLNEIFEKNWTIVKLFVGLNFSVAALENARQVAQEACPEVKAEKKEDEAKEQVNGVLNDLFDAINDWYLMIYF